MFLTCFPVSPQLGKLWVLRYVCVGGSMGEWVEMETNFTKCFKMAFQKQAG